MKTLRSKVGLILFAAALAVAGSTKADHASRTFTSTNDCTIRGRLLDYDVENQRATILRDGSVTPCHAHISIFSDADRQYIQAWAHERDFRNSLNITARLVDEESHETVSNRRYDPQFIKCQAYELKLENRSKTTFVETEIEYCVFYHHIERDGATHAREDGVLCDRAAAGSIAPGSRRGLKTGSIAIYDEDRHTNLFGSDATSYSEVQGIWLRLTATLPSGERLVKDYCVPDDLKECRRWTTTTVAAGLNRKSNGSIRCRAKLTPVELPPVYRLTFN